MSVWEPMPGFHVKSVFFDPMHVIFLGTAKEVIASCLGFWNKKQYLEGRNVAERLSNVSMKQKAYSKQTGLQGPCKTFTPSNTGLDSTDYPELGSVFKAAAMKTVISFFATYAQEISVAHAEAR